MRHVEQSLIEQARITEFELEIRKQLVGLTGKDAKVLLTGRPFIEKEAEQIVDDLYATLIGIPTVVLLISDSETMSRLKSTQRDYIIDLFSGVYDLEYVNNRLRIGLVHKRIGVQPRFFLAAMYKLRSLIVAVIEKRAGVTHFRRMMIDALEKLMYFDASLIFESYIGSLISEIQIAKDKSDEYALTLESVVRERTRQLEELSRRDPLTGVFNRRYLAEDLETAIKAAQRRSEPISFVYLDINDFKALNDKLGHQHGDSVLRTVGGVLSEICRPEDGCYRYGGDEFCIILKNCPESSAREHFCARLTKEVASKLGGVTLSYGIYTTGPRVFDDVNTIVTAADKRMYEAKEAQKHRAAAKKDTKITHRKMLRSEYGAV
ncbi:MAG: GGDEF domain-containing protein [Planctomycetes bacterium]|nr:GGDEF domain-containing protein [Planctomycetota bacterium]